MNPIEKQVLNTAKIVEDPIDVTTLPLCTVDGDDLHSILNLHVLDIIMTEDILKDVDVEDILKDDDLEDKDFAAATLKKEVVGTEDWITNGHGMIKYDGDFKCPPEREKHITDATKIVEQVEVAFLNFENYVADIPRQRAAALKKEMKQKEDWITNGHGEYSTLTAEKEFFDVANKSKNVVLHCYRTSTMRCAIVDKHLDLLAKKHIETKFCKLDIEKAPFLCQRLNIRIIPTIVLCKEAESIDYIVGFDSLGGVDDFTTEMLEWRLAKSGMINYDGDMKCPPECDEHATKIVEQVDVALSKLENYLEVIHQQRAAALKKEMKQKEDWITNGHGEYSTLTAENEFFDIAKKSKNVVLHCYRTSTMRCEIVDKHLDLLAKKYIETKFCKLNVVKAPFLSHLLNIQVIPTIVLLKVSKLINYIAGYDSLGDVDHITTEMLEWRLAKSGMINYDGDLKCPPECEENEQVDSLVIDNLSHAVVIDNLSHAVVIDNVADADFTAIDREKATVVKKNKVWSTNGHGDYCTLKDEKDFLQVQKKNKTVILHCYRDSSKLCRMVDKHFYLLARKYFHTLFVKLDAELARTLCQFLNIHDIPAIVFGKDNEFLAYVKFDSLFGEGCSIEMIERKLAQCGMINYDDNPVPKAAIQDSYLIDAEDLDLTLIQKEIEKNIGTEEEK